MKLLLSLKRKLIKNNTIKKEYTEFIQKNFDRAHASYIPKEQLQKASHKVWYLSHSDVYQPKKPDQLRVVFSCSAVFDNHSLNKHLLQGPDLMNMQSNGGINKISQRNFDCPPSRSSNDSKCDSTIWFLDNQRTKCCSTFRVEVCYVS